MSFDFICKLSCIKSKLPSLSTNSVSDFALYADKNPCFSSSVASTVGPQISL